MGDRIRDKLTAAVEALAPAERAALRLLGTRHANDQPVTIGDASDLAAGTITRPSAYKLADVDLVTVQGDTVALTGHGRAQLHITRPHRRHMPDGGPLIHVKGSASLRRTR